MRIRLPYLIFLCKHIEVRLEIWQIRSEGSRCVALRVNNRQCRIGQQKISVFWSLRASPQTRALAFLIRFSCDSAETSLKLIEFF